MSPAGSLPPRRAVRALPPRAGVDPDRVAVRHESAFQGLIERLDNRPARILDVGAGGFAGATTTVFLLERYPDAHVTAVEVVPAAADRLRERFGAQLEVVTSDILGYVPEEPFDMLVIDLDPSAIPLVFDVMMESVLVPLLRPGAVLVTNVLLDMFNAYHGRQALVSKAQEAAMAAFMLRRFGRLQINDAVLRAAFAGHEELEPILSLEKWRGHPDNVMGWTAFRCHPRAGRWEAFQERHRPGRPPRIRDGARAPEELVPRAELTAMFRGGELTTLDIVGDRAVCRPDCEALLEEWRGYCREHFGPPLQPGELDAKAADALPWSPRDEVEVVIPPLPLAMLEIPDTVEAYMGEIGAKPRNMVRKAERAGYTFRVFEYNDYLDDIFAVKTSKDVRAGGALQSDFRARPQPISPQDTCGVHRSVFFGGFRDATLFAYVLLVQIGELGIIDESLGHGEAMPDGVMNGLYRYVVEWCIADGTVRAMSYSTIVDAAESLVRFKLNVGFRSRVVVFRLPRAVGVAA